MLTGLLNKTTAQELCDMALHTTFKKSGKVALMVIDADHFKNINDTYGHAVGDAVLKTIAQVIKNSFKGMDICGRCGGDEFVVLLREVDNAETALLLGEYLNNKLKEKIKHETYRDEVTLSIGIAISPENGKNFKELFEAADKALYYVKQHGRNGQRIYTDDL